MNRKITRICFFKTLMFVLLILLLFNSNTFTQQKNDTLRFAFISDLHFGKTDYNGEKLHPAEWLKKALCGISKRNADFILVGGDIIDSSDNFSQYDQFDAAMKTKLSWYPIPGNHDIGTKPASITINKIDHWINRGYGRGKSNREFYGIVDKSLAAIYVLNTQAYHSTDPAVLIRADNQLIEMNSFFLANENISIKIVASHVPLFLKNQDEAYDGYFNIEPLYRKKIINIMDKHNVKYYLAGHQHINGSAYDKGIKVFFNTALSFQLGHGNERGYYIYTVTADTLIRNFYPLTKENCVN